MSDTESNDSVDQLEEFRKANVRPGMFVSGWEDPNDEIFETSNPCGKYWFLSYFWFEINVNYLSLTQRIF